MGRIKLASLAGLVQEKYTEKTVERLRYVVGHINNVSSETPRFTALVSEARAAFIHNTLNDIVGMFDEVGKYVDLDPTVKSLGDKEVTKVGEINITVKEDEKMHIVVELIVEGQTVHFQLPTARDSGLIYK